MIERIAAPLPWRESGFVMESALGLVSTSSYPAIVGTADAMLKSAGVLLVGYEKVGGGYCTAVVRGKTSDVRLAVEAGVQTAKEFGQLVTSSIIPRPLANLEAVLPINSRIPRYARKQAFSHFSNQAIGLLETRGFPALVGASNTMLRAAEVHLIGYEKIGAGLCTVIIQGHVADVIYAIDAGMKEAERIGELHAVMVIPRPLDELEQSLPISPALLEVPEPLLLPSLVRQEVGELLELPAKTPER
ncbi:carbon dioxide-concentrating mechanism protein [Gloeobacter morelensis MG652769]|uniref:Carbon dioxide-concentrating mechanism protein n=2 Tax=Gloeobacter TaxID=33071 RepID=A0ABY3PG79_9CYAN|nr:carbon dioxide-concentrating mechanism protein [Gloeobacter morelensis MG652769]